MRFDELDLSDDVLDALDAMRFEECTPIQEQSIPVALEGRDLIAVAQTGTGKTAAYLLPVIDQLAGGGYPEDSVNCIVVCPTRELAQQIDQQMQGFAYFLPVSSLTISGGTDGNGFAQQRKGLKMGADVVIATPGRLLAHLSMGYVDLSRVSFFILDEADRMLDMGFYDDIMQIVKRLPKERQTMMFSATMPDKIQKMAAAILNDPAEVKIAVSKPGDKIDQSAYVCYDGQKTPILRHIFKTAHSKRVIVFAASKLKVKELTRELRKAGVKAAEMHSDLEQSRRDETMLDFRAGRVDILVATDIVARGIDIDDISMVVNYDVPREAEDYVHRIGRTARANNDGKAVTLVNERDRRKFAEIEKFLGKPVPKCDLPEELGSGPSYGGSKSDKSGDGRSDRHGRRRDNSDRKPRADRQRSERKPRRKPQEPAAQTADATTPEANTNRPHNAPAESEAPRRKRSHRGGRNHRRRRGNAPEGNSVTPSPE
ncbi:MAG: DEAD/DEAH box helicase [Candidatus Amulumruptor caecigallinarius]|nr:DEAD/DEAH box helicase [Candidatus Amulumruptor caecigallinarius]MCM1396228.1 DEAD/DEAH box helicase [Candidatus Amulumruptor caecigallinarius]MCM1453772.1 DEAD/DEAH box helicase [bacterium]